MLVFVHSNKIVTKLLSDLYKSPCHVCMYVQTDIHMNKNLKINEELN